MHHHSKAVNCIFCSYKFDAFPAIHCQKSKVLKEITLFCFIYKFIIKQGYKLRIVLSYVTKMKCKLRMGCYKIKSQFCKRPFKNDGYLAYHTFISFNYLLNVRVDPSIQKKTTLIIYCAHFEWSCNCYINYYCCYMIVYEEKYARCRDPSSKYSSSS